jgi:hypothetical protein
MSTSNLLSLSLLPSSMRIRLMPVGHLLDKQNTIEKKEVQSSPNFLGGEWKGFRVKGSFTC